MAHLIWRRRSRSQCILKVIRFQPDRQNFRTLQELFFGKTLVRERPVKLRQPTQEVGRTAFRSRGSVSEPSQPIEMIRAIADIVRNNLFICCLPEFIATRKSLCSGRLIITPVFYPGSFAVHEPRIQRVQSTLEYSFVTSANFWGRSFVGGFTRLC